MLSAFIICRDERDLIGRALSSLDFADEIVVVDSGSTDGTLDIVREYPKVKLFHRDWTGFSDQKNFAIDKCEHEWIFSLDADEAASEELGKRVLSIVQNGGEGNITCYRVRREEYFLGRHLRWGAGNPSFQERFYRKGAVRYSGSVHEYPQVLKGEYGLLDEAIHHNPKLGVERFLSKLNSYTTLEAMDLFRSYQRTNLFHATGTFFTTFCKNYVVYRGYRNGREGIILCFLEAVSRSVRHFKLWALQKNGEGGEHGG